MSAGSIQVSISSNDRRATAALQPNVQSAWRKRNVKILLGSSVALAGVAILAVSVLLWPIAVSVLAVGLGILAHAAHSQKRPALTPDRISHITLPSAKELAKEERRQGAASVPAQLPPPIAPPPKAEEIVEEEGTAGEAAVVEGEREAAAVEEEQEGFAAVEEEEEEAAVIEEEVVEESPSETAPAEEDDLVSTADQVLAAANAVQWAIIGASFFGMAPPIARRMAAAAYIGSGMAMYCLLPKDTSWLRKALAIPMVFQRIVSLHPTVKKISQIHSLYTLASRSISQLSTAWLEHTSNLGGALKAGAVHFFNLVSGVAFAADSAGLIQLGAANRPQTEKAKPSSPCNPTRPEPTKPPEPPKQSYPGEKPPLGYIEWLYLVWAYFTRPSPPAAPPQKSWSEWMWGPPPAPPQKSWSEWMWGPPAQSSNCLPVNCPTCPPVVVKEKEPDDHDWHKPGSADESPPT